MNYHSLQSLRYQRLLKLDWPVVIAALIHPVEKFKIQLNENLLICLISLKNKINRIIN